ncbi:hypothetical protein, partial [Escherichia coli]|uniref:hypothetical protein n=1 Tax=Escherichia coli TaxID=562 RepID=UPI002033447C
MASGTDLDIAAQQRPRRGVNEAADLTIMLDDSTRVHDRSFADAGADLHNAASEQLHAGADLRARRDDRGWMLNGR